MFCKPQRQQQVAENLWFPRTSSLNLTRHRVTGRRGHDFTEKIPVEWLRKKQRNWISPVGPSELRVPSHKILCISGSVPSKKRSNGHHLRFVICQKTLGFGQEIHGNAMQLATQRSSSEKQQLFKVSKCFA